MANIITILLLILSFSGIKNSGSEVNYDVAVTNDPVINRISNNQSAQRSVNYPCQCIDGECGCCTGNVLSNFNINVRNKACANVTYFPEDFEFHLRLIFNNNVFYQRRLSGKNPRPLCASIPRLTALKMCIVFNNVYIISRNIHMCINMEGKYQETTLFSYNFDCIRVGANGIALLKPEEGGGLGPPAPVVENVTNEEDYDAIVASEGDEIESAKRWRKGSLLLL